jgi:subtilase family serine protease
MKISLRETGKVIGEHTAPGLVAMGRAYDYCFVAENPYPEAEGPMHVVLTVDGEDAIAEMNEKNNSTEFTAVFNPIGSQQAQTGGATAGASKPDLTVSAIRVKGSDPSGNNDCDPGNNQVDVVIKNQGSTPAGGFLVELVVDNGSEPPRGAGVPGLAAGAEYTAGIGTVTLQKGQHSLTASVDGRNQVAESDEDDNKKTVNVTCKDEDN